MRDAVTWVLVGVGVAVQAFACLGVLLMRDALDRLHYVSASAVGIACVCAAVVVAEGPSLIGLKALADRRVPARDRPGARARDRARDPPAPRGARMSALQTVCLLAVAVAGTATVLTRDPLRQTVSSGMFGLTLAILFLAFGAPDVALSQIVVAGVAVPVMVLLALAKIRTDERRREE